MNNHSLGKRQVCLQAFRREIFEESGTTNHYYLRMP